MAFNIMLIECKILYEQRIFLNYTRKKTYQNNNNSDHRNTLKINSNLLYGSMMVVILLNILNRFIRNVHWRKSVQANKLIFNIKTTVKQDE